jgi:hypothetical protein
MPLDCIRESTGVRAVNEKDLQLVHSISAVIDDGSSSIYVLHAKYTNLVRVNLVLLKAFLEEKRRKGLMITIDRPHQYVSHLMQLHGVDQSNLTFIDAISTHAADTKGGAVAPEFQRGPFHIEALPDFLMKPENNGSGLLVDLSKIDFIVIDNVSTLLTYNTMDSIKRFFEKYVEMVKSVRPGGIQTALVMDRDQHPQLFEFVSSMARKAIDLGPDMMVKKISVMGVPVPVVTQPMQQIVGPGELGTGVLRSKEVM